MLLMCGTPILYGCSPTQQHRYGHGPHVYPGSGPYSSPGPLPCTPYVLRYAQFWENTWTQSLLLSATYTLYQQGQSSDPRAHSSHPHHFLVCQNRRQICVKYTCRYPVIPAVTDKELVILTECNAIGIIKPSCPATLTTN